MTSHATCVERKPDQAEGTNVKLEFKSMKGQAHNKELWIRKLQEGKDANYTWSPDAEPHIARRREILAKHPKIMELYRTDIWSAVFCTGTVIFQLSMAYLCTHLPWWAVVILTYCPGGFIAQSLQLAMHELSHDLWFKTRRWNQYFAFFANLPTGVASSATFRRYHLEHHTYQGVDQWDVDIPSHIETYLLRYTWGKCLFCMFTPIFYSFRPMFMRPKPMNKDEMFNWVVQLSFDAVVLHFFGVKAFFYLLFGSFFGMGIHPMTAHFISEHFEFIPGQETYSYYGPLNMITYNVGYHNEHHDFPKIPGRLLPEVTKIAPEYYDNIPSYTSWCQVLYDFIFFDKVSLWSRIKREEDTMFKKD